MELARPLSVTFHRAFDWTRDPFEALDSLIEVGVDRILSSGQASRAALGIELLVELQKRAKNRLEILPGGGINASNITKFKALRFSAVHTSASEITVGKGVGDIPMNTPKMLAEGIRIESDLERIQNLVGLINN